MAQFHVGQRVRVVGKYGRSSARVGAEGIIVAPFVIDRGGLHYDWEVEINGEDGWIFPNAQLAPPSPTLPPSASSNPSRS